MFDWFKRVLELLEISIPRMQDGRVAKNKRLSTEQLGERLFKKLKISEENAEEPVNEDMDEDMKDELMHVQTVTTTSTPPPTTTTALILYNEPTCPKPDLKELLQRIHELPSRTVPLDPIVMNLKAVFEVASQKDEHHQEVDSEMMILD